MKKALPLIAAIMLSCFLVPIKVASAVAVPNLKYAIVIGASDWCHGVDLNISLIWTNLLVERCILS